MRVMYKENLMGCDCREEVGWAIGSLGTREEGQTEAKDEWRVQGDSWEDGVVHVHIYTCVDPFHVEGSSGSGKVLPRQNIIWTATANYPSRCESPCSEEGRGWEWVCLLLCAGAAAV